MNKPIKVLHLFDFYLPHTMNWAYRSMRATSEFDYWIAAPWIVQNEYYHPEFRFFSRPLQCGRPLPATEWTNEWLSSKLIRLEKYCPLYRRWLETQLRKYPPDIMHAHFGPVGCHFLPLAEKLGIPLITSFYGYDYESLPFRKPIYLEKYRRLFLKSAATTAMGPHGKEVLMRHGCPPEKVHVQRLTIDLEGFPFSVRMKPADRLNMVQIGTITEKKGHLITLKALQIARQRCPQVHLTIAGERVNRVLVRQMQHFIQNHNLQEHVTWLDFLPHEKLAEFLSRFDVFIHPSHYSTNRDCEGGPVVILEAQATGLPVISSLHFDIPTEVLDGQTGLLAPEQDAAGLAGHIGRFYQMKNDEYQKFSQAARHHIETNFHLRIAADSLAKLYREIVAQNQSAF